MPFNSIPYILLFSLSFISIRVLRSKVSTLLFFSLIFFCYAGFFDFFIFILTVLVNWLILTTLNGRSIKLYLAIFFNTSLLLFFKYSNFFINNLVLNSGFNLLSDFYPLGISFYCFQSIGYQIDVYKGLTIGAKNFKDFLLFKSFFPQLIAGPIVRARTFIPQIRNFRNKKFKFRLLTFGFFLIFMGLFKKIVFADSISLFVDEVFRQIPRNANEAWIGALLYSFQVYFDFSGYSDIAIGSAYLLGFRLPKNFDTPYLSFTPSGFWKRWHISLSEWIKDYIYIPLGGSKKGFLRSSFILIFTMFIAGIWHGGKLNFLLWGICWGIYIVMGRLIKIDRKFSFLAWPLHIIFVIMLWVLFRANDISYAISYWKIMLGFGKNVNLNLNSTLVNAVINPNLSSYFWTLIISFFGFHLLEYYFKGKRLILFLKNISSLYFDAFLTTLIYLLVLIPDFNTNPFIYFRF